MQPFIQAPQHTVPLQAKDLPGSPERGAKIKEKPKKALTDQGGRMVLCRACGSPLAPLCARMAVNGSHTHVFFNPHGLVFEVACFSSAPGAIPVGRSTVQFTWFSGHIWRVALCTGCQAHLGWHFQGDSNSFFGFITNAIREADAP